jgi:hypothetical protein
MGSKTDMKMFKNEYVNMYINVYENRNVNGTKTLT